MAYLPNHADAAYFDTLKLAMGHGLVPQAELATSPSETSLAGLAVILQSIVFPLQSVIESDRHLVYVNFVQGFLASASLHTDLFSLIPISTFRKLLDVRQLLEATSKLRIDQMNSGGTMWLLSYLIAFVYEDALPGSPHQMVLEHHLFSHPLYKKPQKPINSRPMFELLVVALNPILNAYGNHMWGPTANSIKISTPSECLPTNPFIEGNGCPDPPEFIRRQLEILLGTDFITDVVDSITRNPTPLSSIQSMDTFYASQSLILRLLLYFRFLQRKLHNRLFLARSRQGVSLLAALYYQIQETHTFRSGVTSVKVILEGLKLTYNKSAECNPKPLEWTAIFLFLDLYCFSNIVMDDEEFFSFEDRSLKPNQLKDLVSFLKNLAFSIYFEVSEIELQTSNELVRQLPSEPDYCTRFHTRSDVAGLHGISVPWIRNLTIAILRSLHRRDSRQKFLPDGFWLMKEIDTEGTTHLIAEEEARQWELEETNIADSESESDNGGISQATFESGNKCPNRRRDKSSRRNYMAAITPRLGVIQNLPFLIPFRTRVSIFRDFIRLDQARRGTGDRDLWRLNQANALQDQPSWKAKHHGIIHRNRVFDDAYDEFYALGDGFKEPIQITFIDSFGAEEPGIDGGGILKEFLSSLVQESCRTSSAKGAPFFTETESHLLYPNPNLLDQMSWDSCTPLEDNNNSSPSKLSVRDTGDLLRRVEFLGRIIGKCMYEGILVEVAFADFFLLKWSKVMLGNDDVGLGIDDLKSLDTSLWKGLQALKHYDEQTIKDLDLTFAIENNFQMADRRSPSGFTRKIMLVDLKPGGSHIPVTSSNRLEYIHLVSKYKLAVQGKQQTNAFLRGLSSIISPRWLSMFNQSELQTLVGGNESPLDVDDLRKNTVYGGVYTIGDDNQEHETVKMFWQVMKRLRESDKRSVLKFVTSVSRAPLLGFSSLNPRFSIRDAGSDSTRLPSTSTCVNLLKLPRYTSEAVLEEKLLYAANAGAGFDLS
ncbi:hypothetical protein TWF730_002236 [Orbilia blumenaviensis]